MTGEQGNDRANVTGTSRLEAFSDGVMAVIMTIMAFELRAPGGSSFSSLTHRLPALLVYILSFTFIGIYWNNHHHLLRVTPRMSSAVMWANLYLLFWLSLIPVATEWVATQYGHPWPAATYGIVRGTVVMHDGKVVSSPGYGKFTPGTAAAGSISTPAT